jgi:hypothetical protein
MCSDNKAEIVFTCSGNKGNMLLLLYTIYTTLYIILYTIYYTTYTIIYGTLHYSVWLQFKRMTVRVTGLLTFPPSSFQLKREDNFGTG